MRELTRCNMLRRPNDFKGSLIRVRECRENLQKRRASGRKPSALASAPAPASAPASAPAPASARASAPDYPEPDFAGTELLYPLKDPMEEACPCVDPRPEKGGEKGYATCFITKKGEKMTPECQAQYDDIVNDLWNADHGTIDRRRYRDCSSEYDEHCGPNYNDKPRREIIDGHWQFLLTKLGEMQSKGLEGLMSREILESADAILGDGTRAVDGRVIVVLLKLLGAQASIPFMYNDTKDPSTLKSMHITVVEELEKVRKEYQAEDDKSAARRKRWLTIGLGTLLGTAGAVGAYKYMQQAPPSAAPAVANEPGTALAVVNDPGTELEVANDPGTALEVPGVTVDPGTALEIIPGQTVQSPWNNPPVKIVGQAAPTTAVGFPVQQAAPTTTAVGFPVAQYWS